MRKWPQGLPYDVRGNGRRGLIQPSDSPDGRRSDPAAAAIAVGKQTSTSRCTMNLCQNLRHNWLLDVAAGTTAGRRYC